MLKKMRGKKDPNVGYRLIESSPHLSPRGMLNKAGYTATPVACGWAGAVIEVTRSFGQEQ